MASVINAVVGARDAAERALTMGEPEIEAAAEAFLDCTAPDDDGKIDMAEHLIAACKLISALVGA
jgi:hypothetical protein